MTFASRHSAFAQEIFDHIRRMSVDGLGVTRQGYSDLETRVLQYLIDFGQGFGMEVQTDGAGNVWLTLPGVDRSKPAIVSGSHVDSVPRGGNFDGLAGAVAALCVARRFAQRGRTPAVDYRVLLLRCEESSFFGKAYVGSLGMMGRLTEKDLSLKHRSKRIALGQAMQAQGVDLSVVQNGQPSVDLTKIGAFIELHIEQGPTLTSQEKSTVGIVTGIRGNIRHKKVRCLGETAHSGAVNKEYRHDAVMAVCEFLHTMENHWQAWLEMGHDLVFTTGVLKTNATAAISVIPGEVEMTMDIRSLKKETLRLFHELCQAEAKRIATKRGVKFEWDPMLFTAPATLTEEVENALEAAAQKAELNYMKLASGAGHDSAVFANAGVPTGMIFIANQNGSHNPYEAMRLDDFLLGAELLWETVHNGMA